MLTQEGTDSIEFDQPEDLLLQPELLPGDGWESNEGNEPEFLDENVTYVREFGENEEVDGDEGDTWIVNSAVGARDNEADAVDLYEEFYADWRGQVGDARIMDLNLGSEGAIAGYDGFTAALFRDVNCVGSVSFTDCVNGNRLCTSHVSRTEELARAKRESWREPTETGEENGSEETDEANEDENGDPEFVDQAQGQVELQYGETAALSNGVMVTAHGVQTTDQLGEEVPEERGAFALVELEAVNEGDDASRLPMVTDPGLQVLFEDQQVDPTFNYSAFQQTEYQPYEGDEVEPGVRRAGYVLYAVAAGLSESDIDFLWQDDLFVVADLDETVNVRWTAG